MSTLLIIVAALLCAAAGIAALVGLSWFRTQRNLEAEETAVREGLGANTDAITWARHEARSDDYGFGDGGGDGGGGGD